MVMRKWEIKRYDAFNTFTMYHNTFKPYKKVTLVFFEDL